MASLIPGGASRRAWTGQCDTRVNRCSNSFRRSCDPCYSPRRVAGGPPRQEGESPCAPTTRPAPPAPGGTGLVLLAASAVLAAQPNVVSTNPVPHTMAPANTAISITFDQPL